MAPQSLLSADNNLSSSTNCADATPSEVSAAFFDIFLDFFTFLGDLAIMLVNAFS